DEFCWIFGVINDVDLFIIEFGHHRANSASHLTDAGTFGVNSWFIRFDSDLGPVACLTGNGCDFNTAIGNFWNFKFKKFPYQAGVRTRERNGWSLIATAYRHHVGTESGTV